MELCGVASTSDWRRRVNRMFGCRRRRACYQDFPGTLPGQSVKVSRDYLACCRTVTVFELSLSEVSIERTEEPEAHQVLGLLQPGAEPDNRSSDQVMAGLWRYGLARGRRPRSTALENGTLSCKLTILIGRSASMAGRCRGGPLMRIRKLCRPAERRTAELGFRWGTLPARPSNGLSGCGGREDHRRVQRWLRRRCRSRRSRCRWRWRCR